MHFGLPYQLRPAARERLLLREHLNKLEGTGWYSCDFWIAILSIRGYHTNSRMSNPKSTFSKYCAIWPSGMDELMIEVECIKRGGKWTGSKGQECGTGLFEHYMNFRKLVWPERYRHRWTDLIYKHYIENQIMVLMGPASSQKTSGAVECVLIDYWCYPNDTLVLLSTTKIEKLEMGVFGEMKMLWEKGHTRYPWLCGNILDNKHAITTDNLKDDGVRDMRKGVIGRALYQGSQYVGLGHWAGIKQKKIRFVGDELQFCSSSFLDVLPNMMGSTDVDAQGNPDFKFVGSGNPKHDPYDQLSVIAEPSAGWLSLGDIKKTTVWKLKGFEKGVCINLIGSDSPNFDVPEGSVEPFPRLISRAFIKMVEKRWGKGSMKWYSQCEGKMMMNMVGNRVITKELCERHGAFNPVIWKDDNQTRVAFLDPAWAGQNADRCVFGWLDFGIDVTDKLVMSFCQYMVIPFPPNSRTEPDDIIAQFVQAQCRANDIQPENVFYDSSGKGTTGAALARVFGDRVPVPIYFGGNPTPRPVRHDLFVTEKNGEKRLKRCDEEYKKFVTELWFSSRNVIECGQMRNLPQEVAHEGCLREYIDAAGGKIEIEKKEDTRERMGMSPDLYDAFVCGVEGARQLGFKIERLGEEIIESPENDPDYFDTEAKKYADAIKSALPQHNIN